ncbi:MULTISPECIES: alternative ribosome rescue aminoacyl-tRNA hydrolase ArfB [Rhodococcus]|uniref:alternative ribosome rescue aminoacyl-tRNA hydrolase ArfB n=1 Tax=Rhodococcus sp. IEGM 1305 TaxID=3047092 RepID=UPI002476BAD0|nr:MULTISPECIES: alternative ribosome rescue aminoacyl-tRNA hydrolase ArfB [Rhodococcus]MDI9948577.1 alternative ribosome rescue aminoacyl-tRNA hydrolase ArfB [Rhodococcus sp. IEGM 1305]MDV7087185.1 alternative ribosome rescue aminoacyl-tRNA hydrolase ArfB [Rhodococcus opacus]
MFPGGEVTDDLEITRSLVVPAAELQWRFSRAGGPGGQGVNTTDSRVELRVNLWTLSTLSPSQLERMQVQLGHRLIDGVVTVTASETRSQLRNRRAARARMAALLRAAVLAETRTRRPTKATKGSHRRRLDAKKQRGQTKNLRRKPDM